ncbi:hypothetical protein STEG23_015914, partial [Scotinomys teguina]
NHGYRLSLQLHQGPRLQPGTDISMPPGDGRPLRRPFNTVFPLSITNCTWPSRGDLSPILRQDHLQRTNR